MRRAIKNQTRICLIRNKENIMFKTEINNIIYYISVVNSTSGIAIPMA